MSDCGKFIVVFKDHVTSEQIGEYVKQVEGAGGSVGERYDEGAGILNGFAATLPASFQQSLAADSAIAYIEPDGVVTTQK